MLFEIKQKHRTLFYIVYIALFLESNKKNTIFLAVDPSSFLEFVACCNLINGFFLLKILQGLQSENTSVRAPWTDREIKSLVEYIALFCDLGEDCERVEKPWPHTKSTSFWDSCAEAIAEHTGLPLRSRM